MKDNALLAQAQNLIRAEGEVVAAMANQLDHTFVEMAHLIANCEGKVLLTGAGTSGTIARRIAHLLGTCGVSAFFLHPADALHGPAAVINAGDIVIALSKAGKSAEINRLAQIARQRGGQVISWTGNPESELAQHSDLVIVLRPDARGEGDGILPFGSSLANGALGDALCITVKNLRGFDLAELTRTHPAGATGELVRQDSDSIADGGKQ